MYSVGGAGGRGRACRGAEQREAASTVHTPGEDVVEVGLAKLLLVRWKGVVPPPSNEHAPARVLRLVGQAQWKRGLRTSQSSGQGSKQNIRLRVRVTVCA